MHSTHKDTAEGNPNEGNRAIARSEDSTEDWARTRNIQELNKESAPTRHRHIVYAIVELFARNRGFRVYFSNLIEILTVNEIGCHKQN